MKQRCVETPIGPLMLVEDGGRLLASRFHRSAARDATPLLDEAERQLGAYFAGKLRRFDLPLAPAGPAFQQRIWAAMAEIPYGETRSYGDLARLTGSSARAVGQACGANPLPIILPCHRVLAAGGKLGGYSGGDGLATKRRLLQLEGALQLLFV